MDPNAVLEMLRSAERCLAQALEHQSPVDVVEALATLEQNARTLREWVLIGGYLPSAS